MTTPSGILRHEHRLHRRMLRVLGALTQRIAADEALCSEDMASALAYFADFAEGLHQVKEYEFLYPAAAMMEFAGAAERVGQLIAEQHQTRMLFDSLRSAWDPGELDQEGSASFVKLARAYAARLCWQMDREDDLLVLLGEFLGEEEARDMLDQFIEADRDSCSAAEWEAEIARLESACGRSQ